MNDLEREAGLAETPNYRYADRMGDELFVAGQVPLDGSGGLIGRGDPAAQATACLDNLGILLGVHGFEPTDLRHVTVHVVGEQQSLGDAWDAVVAWFDGEVPPATLLGAHLLGHRHQLVEIDARILRRRG